MPDEYYGWGQPVTSAFYNQPYRGCRTTDAALELMSDIDIQRLVAVLEEIRDNQRLQLERQAEALALQREQFALVQKQYERVD